MSDTNPETNVLQSGGGGGGVDVLDDNDQINRSDSLSDDASSFPLTLNANTAWMIQGVVHPGPDFSWPYDSIPSKADNIVRPLRRKINNAILRMIDEEVKDVVVPCTEAEAWILDAHLSFDGPDGPATDIILQVVRGLWYLDIGQHMAPRMYLVDDPHKDWPEMRQKTDSRSPGLPDLSSLT